MTWIHLRKTNQTNGLTTFRIPKKNTIFKLECTTHFQIRSIINWAFSGNDVNHWASQLPNCGPASQLRSLWSPVKGNETPSKKLPGLLMIDIFRLLIWSSLNSRFLKNNYPNITLANKHLIYFHIYFDIYIIFISRFGAILYLHRFLRDLNSRSKKPVRPLPLHPSTLRRMHPAGLVAVDSLITGVILLW